MVHKKLSLNMGLSLAVLLGIRMPAQAHGPQAAPSTLVIGR